MVIIINGRKQSALVDQLRRIPDFIPFEHISSPDVALGLDTKSKQIGLCIRADGTVRCDALPFAALTGVDIQRADGGSTKMTRSAFSGFTTTGTLSSLSLALTFDHPQHGSVVIDLFYQTGQRNVDDLMRQSAFQTAHKWHAKLMAIVRSNASSVSQIGKFDSTTIEAPNRAEKVSLADQLERISKLRAEGVLSEEEFIVAKRRLLNERAAETDGT